MIITVRITVDAYGIIRLHVSCGGVSDAEWDLLGLPIVHRGMEPSAVDDGLGQREALEDDAHVPLVGSLVHLAGHVEAVVELAAVGQYEVEGEHVRGPGLGREAEGEGAARDHGLTVRVGREGDHAPLPGNGAVAHEKRARHAREGCPDRGDVLEVLHSPDLEAAGAHLRLHGQHQRVRLLPTDGEAHAREAASPYLLGRQHHGLVAGVGAPRLAASAHGLAHRGGAGVYLEGLVAFRPTEQDGLGVVVQVYHPVVSPRYPGRAAGRVGEVAAYGPATLLGEEEGAHPFRPRAGGGTPVELHTHLRQGRGREIQVLVIARAERAGYECGYERDAGGQPDGGRGHAQGVQGVRAPLRLSSRRLSPCGA